ncbi:uronyl 2-sulfotransferase-like [Clavelina lepadiformis]|uniref:uronyl 2-sulfotransferase-like n=1 Tax=Clavelina lepadiformis TaxID=159417 RepID=UPI0040424B0C
MKNYFRTSKMPFLKWSHISIIFLITSVVLIGNSWFYLPKNPFSFSFSVTSHLARKTPQVSTRLYHRIINDNYIPNRILYNRVTKCGSRTLAEIISHLEWKNNFCFYQSPVNNLKRPPPSELARETKFIYDLWTPSLYARHIHYIDFTKYGLENPTYINVVRDPIERFSSQFHYKRFNDFTNSLNLEHVRWKSSENKEMNINDCIIKNHLECSTKQLWYIVPYFCGQDEMCQHPSNESLQQAIANVERHYLFVGILEDFKGTLQVFERLLPGYFAGGTEIAMRLQNRSHEKTKTLKKDAITPKAYELLKSRMSLEYQFYEFIAQRFNATKSLLKLT